MQVVIESPKKVYVATVIAVKEKCNDRAQGCQYAQSAVVATAGLSAGDWMVSVTREMRLSAIGCPGAST